MKSQSHFDATGGMYLFFVDYCTVLNDWIINESVIGKCIDGSGH
jgi:hypothetical protein